MIITEEEPMGPTATASASALCPAASRPPPPGHPCFFLEELSFLPCCPFSNPPPALILGDSDNHKGGLSKALDSWSLPSPPAGLLLPASPVLPHGLHSPTPPSLQPLPSGSPAAPIHPFHQDHRAVTLPPFSSSSPPVASTSLSLQARHPTHHCNSSCTHPLTLPSLPPSLLPPKRPPWFRPALCTGTAEHTWRKRHHTAAIGKKRVSLLLHGSHGIPKTRHSLALSISRFHRFSGTSSPLFTLSQ